MARPKLGESKSERLHMMITADEIAAIDDWRYANHIPSRSEAVRKLVQIALGPRPTRRVARFTAKAEGRS